MANNAALLSVEEYEAGVYRSALETVKRDQGKVSKSNREVCRQLAKVEAEDYARVMATMEGVEAQRQAIEEGLQRHRVAINHAVDTRVAELHAQVNDVQNRHALAVEKADQEHMARRLKLREDVALLDQKFRKHQLDREIWEAEFKGEQYKADRLRREAAQAIVEQPKAEVLDLPPPPSYRERLNQAIEEAVEQRLSQARAKSSRTPVYDPETGMVAGFRLNDGTFEEAEGYRETKANHMAREAMWETKIAEAEAEHQAAMAELDEFDQAEANQEHAPDKVHPDGVPQDLVAMYDSIREMGGDVDPNFDGDPVED